VKLPKYGNSLPRQRNKVGLFRFHPGGGDVPFCCVKVDLRPFRFLQFARADEYQGGRSARRI
jgi:hypothetical protein